MSEGIEFTSTQTIPSRVRVAILGGGAHGLGIMHDLLSRGWKDVILIEKGKVGCGTSSRSTKLIHGGLRYLQRLSGFPLVKEALHERATLMRVAPEVTRPMKFCLPVLAKGGYPGFYIRTGLFLYDFLAGRHNLNRHSVLDHETLRQEMAPLQHELFSRCYAFWDTQTDDLMLMRKIAMNAKKMGGTILSDTKALHVSPTSEGWTVKIKSGNEEPKEISALYVINALGPWANEFLEASHLQPEVEGVNIKGAHILVPNLGHKIGAYLQSPEDGRIFFILPWYEYSLIGTTETLHTDKADGLLVDENDIDYILHRCNRFLREPVKASDIKLSFAGMRWLAKEKGLGLSAMSRSDHVSHHPSLGRGRLLTIYGGKLTTYRSLSEQIGDFICQDFGEFVPSQTKDPSHWSEVVDGPSLDDPNPDILKRFSQGGEGYTPYQRP